VAEHGTIGGYVDWFCRCEECRDAARDYRRKRLRKIQRRIRDGDDPTPHGTINGYVNYRCRCADCVQANSVYRAERKRAKP
jgi:hypothetical protein